MRTISCFECPERTTPSFISFRITNFANSTKLKPKPHTVHHNWKHRLPTRTKLKNRPVIQCQLNYDAAVSPHLRRSTHTHPHTASHKTAIPQETSSRTRTFSTHFLTLVEHFQHTSSPQLEHISTHFLTNSNGFNILPLLNSNIFNTLPSPTRTFSSPQVTTAGCVASRSRVGAAFTASTFQRRIHLVPPHTTQCFKINVNISSKRMSAS